jgi:hypothetical protein
MKKPMLTLALGLEEVGSSHGLFDALTLNLHTRGVLHEESPAVITVDWYPSRTIHDIQRHNASVTYLRQYHTMLNRTMLNRTMLNRRKTHV